jgi:predicted nucleic acid-binding Zn ribbon protein
MARSEQDYLLELWEKKVCPNCGNSIPEGKRVGSGKKSEGGFCSLDCFAGYYKAELMERAKRVAAMAQRHRNS